MMSTYRFYLVAVLMFVFSGCDNKPGGQFTNPDTRLITMGLDLVAQREYQQALPYLKDCVDQITTRQIKGGQLQFLDSIPISLELQPAEIAHLLAFCYQKVGQTQKALSYYSLAADPKNLLIDYVLHHQAKLYSRHDYHEQSIATYNQLTQDYPKHPQNTTAKFQLAKIYLQQNKFGALTSMLKKLKQESIDQRRVCLLIAQSLLKQKKWNESYKICNQLIAAKTSDWIAWEALVQIGKIHQSVPNIHRSTDQLMNEAMVYYHNRHFDRCRSIFRSIIKKSDRSQKIAGRAAYKIGYSFYRQREYSNAIHWFRQVINKYPASDYLTRAYYRLTVCYRRKGFVTRAEINLKIFTKKYQWSQLLADALYDLGRIYERQKRYPEATFVYRRLVDNHSRSRLIQRTYWQMGWTQFKSGLWKDCLQTFETLQRKYPTDTYALVSEYWTAKCYRRLGQEKMAKAKFNQVAEKKKWYYSSLANQHLADSKIPRLDSYNDSLVWRGLGEQKSPRAERLMQFGMFEDAITELEAAFRSAGEIKQINHVYNLMICHQKTGNYQKVFSYANQLQSFSQLKNANGYLPIELYRTLYPFYYADEIIKHATNYGIDPLFVAAMIREESRYNAKIVSPAGARGLMQVMIPTGKFIAKKIKFPNFKRDLLFEPQVNIQFGTWYMSDLMRKFDGNCSLVAGAYNGGPGRIKNWLKKAKSAEKTIQSQDSIISEIDMEEFVENIPIDETRRHIKKVMDSYSVYQHLYGELINNLGKNQNRLSSPSSVILNKGRQTN